MMLDFGVLPPEVNSAMMYAGPGSGPMMAAASAWSGLAAELSSATASYQLATSRLTQSWLGPASTSMAAAAAPYVAWMSHTATQAQQTATQAASAAAAYESAFAATVPPPVIAANRTQLMSLVATNFLGQNTPAITATEAVYAEMWAQDAAAMYGYAASSSAATTLTPFNEPTQNTSPTGQSVQTAAVTQAVGTSSATNSQTTLSQAMSAVPQQLQSLSTAGSSGAPTASATSLLSSAGSFNTLSGPTSFASATFRSVTSAMSGFSGVYRSGLQSGGSAAKAIAGAANGAANAVSAGSVRGAVLASVGKTVPIGELSVPSSWSAATPAISPAAAPQWLPSTNLGAVPAMAENEPGMMGGAPMAGMGQMTGMLRPRTVSSILRIAPRRFVMPRPAVGG